jgi:hypothetical protein
MSAVTFKDTTAHTKAVISESLDQAVTSFLITNRNSYFTHVCDNQIPPIRGCRSILPVRPYGSVGYGRTRSELKMGVLQIEINLWKDIPAPISILSGGWT